MTAGSEHPRYLWWNGKLTPWDEAMVHVTEVGWSSVSAIFEGIMSYWNADDEELYVFQLDAHLRRLLRSEKVMRMRQDYSVAALREAVVELLRANEYRADAYIQPLAYPTGSGSFRRLNTVEPSPVDLRITTRPSPSHLLKGEGKHACISSWTRISDNVMPPRVKNLSNYRNSQLASSQAAIDGYDTPILLNAAGKVAEGPGACLMLVRDGRLITPPVTDSILESITRGSVIELARNELGLEVVERSVDRTELYIADEVFFCGTAAEITPIVSVDRYAVGDGGQGPITTQLERVFYDVVHGCNHRYAGWVTPVGVARAVSAD